VRTSVLIAGSVALHVAGFAMISRKAKEIEKKQTLIEVVEKQKQEEEKKAEPEPKPIEAAAEVLQPKQLARPTEAAPASEAAPTANEAPSPQMQTLPDVGALSSGGGGGAGGSGSLPTGGGGGGNGGGKPVEKTLGTPKPASTVNPDLADEIAAWKPKPVARVKPVYPDDARTAEIEGTVTVEVVIDCTGKVVSARITKGLGHGLDGAALTAIKKTEFAPASRCAPGLQKSMKINYAFRLGD